MRGSGVMEPIKIGIIGLGGMGKKYAAYIKDGKAGNAIVTALTCRGKEKLQWAKDHIGEVACFESGEALIENGDLDGVIIATPHNTHPYFAKLAFKKNLHVLIEKPAGVRLDDVYEMNVLAKESGKVFGIMFDRRLEPIFQKVKQLLEDRIVGTIHRINWISTVYRSQEYYDADAWRGSWEGEGGGVLLNQTQHQLDLWQWFFGMPKKIRGFCHFGKYHRIEVEDEATLYMEYDQQCSGVFVASTFEMPEMERLEIVGSKGKILLEENELTLWKVNDYPNYIKEKEQFTSNEMRRAHMIADWVISINENKPFVAPGAEGIYPLILNQSAYLSNALDKWIQLPLNQDDYNEIINQNYLK
jgi:predicted dehydrogenase